MKKNRHHHKTMFAGAAIAVAATSPTLAQQRAFHDAGTSQPPVPPPSITTNTPVPITTNNPVQNFLNGKIPDAIAQGKFNVNARLRYEQVDEENVPSVTKNSYAETLRTRFGYTTAPLYGFQGMLEGVNVTSLGPEHEYNAAGSNHQNDRPVVADPPLTRVDQAWVSYSYSNYFTVKAGDQQINIDNQRFIGDSGWRQNIQTFDAAAVGSEPIRDLNLYYAYIWDVHRVFGDVDGLPAANTDFDSHSHLINISYSGWKYGQFTAYSYLLDLHNAAGDANSCATFGGFFEGEAPICEKTWVDYRAEFAWQTDFGDSPLRYGTKYYNLEVGERTDPFAFGVGYEDLGSDSNSGAGGSQASFRTPLATLHQFNGWADVFLSTPNDGLRDLYGYGQIMLPCQIPLRLIYHKYDAAFGNHDYGQELDAVISKKFGAHWAAMLKFANYRGADSAPPALTVAKVNIQKFWAQAEFMF